MAHREDLAAHRDGSDAVQLDPVDAQHRQAVAEAIGAWIAAQLGDQEGDDAARQHLHAVERIAGQVEELVAGQRRRAALFAFGSGWSWARIADELGLSRWALPKRWPDLKQWARPYRWLGTNLAEWTQAVDDLLALEEPGAGQLPDAQREAVARLRATVEAHRMHPRHWWLLADAPELARSIVADRDPGSDTRRHVIYDWVHALLSDRDRTCCGEKATSRIEVTRAAIQAATEARLGRHGDVANQQ